MDETWIHHFTLGSNQLSAEGTAAGENRPKQPKLGFDLYFGMCKVFCSSVTLRKEEPSIANII